jgi:hypothetical protein
MSIHKFLVSIFTLVFVLLSACAPSAMLTPTAIPPTATSTAMYLPKTFKLPMNLSFDGDWQVRYDLPGKFALDHQHHFGLSFYIVTNAKLVDPMDGHLIPFPEDFLAWIQSDPDFSAVTSTPVTVAGIEGLQIDATPIWKSATTQKYFLSLSGKIWLNAEGQPDGENIVTDPEQWRFILLNNVNKERLLMILIDGNGHNFEEAVKQSQVVLDSVAFTE